MDCGRGHRITHEFEDDYGHVHRQYEWEPACKWKPLTTFRDQCTVCGKIFQYPNSNGYPEDNVKDQTHGR
jgi:hypothetical protein